MNANREDDFKFSFNQNGNLEFWKDTLYVEDKNIRIKLEKGNLRIIVFVPQTDDCYDFNYRVVGAEIRSRSVTGEK